MLLTIEKMDNQPKTWDSRWIDLRQRVKSGEILEATNEQLAFDAVTACNGTNQNPLIAHQLVNIGSLVTTLMNQRFLKQIEEQARAHSNAAEERARALHEQGIWLTKLAVGVASINVVVAIAQALIALATS